MVVRTVCLQQQVQLLAVLCSCQTASHLAASGPRGQTPAAATHLRPQQQQLAQVPLQVAVLVLLLLQVIRWPATPLASLLLQKKPATKLSQHLRRQQAVSGSSAAAAAAVAEGLLLLPAPPQGSSSSLLPAAAAAGVHPSSSRQMLLQLLTHQAHQQQQHQLQQRQMSLLPAHQQHHHQHHCQP